MFVITLIATLLVIFKTGCVLLEEPNFKLDCLSEKEVELKKKFYSEIDFKKTFPEDNLKNSEWKLLDNQCSKKYFKYGDNIYALIYRNPVTLEVNGLYKNEPFQIGSQACFDNALNQLNSLEITWVKPMLAKAKKELGVRWNDFIVGPAVFLNCENHKDIDVEYALSLNGFVHAMSLEASKACFFNVKTQKSGCWLNRYKNNSLSKLSVRKNILINRKSIAIPKEIASFQERELTSLKESLRPAVLLTSLQGYTLRLEIERLSMKKAILMNKRRYSHSPTAFISIYDIFLRLQKLLSSEDASFNKKPIGKEIEYLLTEGRKNADMYFKECLKTTGKTLNDCHHNYAFWTAVR